MKKKAKLLESNEIFPILGSVQDTKLWEKYAASSDVIVEAVSDLNDLTGSVEATQKVLIDLKKKFPKKVIFYTSGSWVYGSSNDLVDENSVTNSIPLVAWRAKIEDAFLAVGAIVVRAGLLYGSTGSITSAFFKQIKEGNGIVCGDESTNWGMIHSDDLSDIYYRIAIAGNQFDGHIFNGVAFSQNGRKAYEAIARVTGFKGKIEYRPFSNPWEEALAINQSVSSNKAKNLLGWNPKQLPFADGIEKYYMSWKVANQ